MARQVTFNPFTGKFQFVEDTASAIGDTITDGTAGSVLFIDASGNLGEDNSNLYWDDSNNVLKHATTKNDITLPSTGYSLSFDGTNSVSLSAVDTPHSLASYTVAFWMKCPASNAQHTMPLTIYYTDAKSPFQMLKFGSTYTIRVGDGSTATDTNGSDTVWDNAWHHIVVTFDDSTKALKSYIDNSADIDTTLAHGAYTGTEPSFQISGREVTVLRIVGQIDEVKVYDVALTSGEVSTEYNSGDGRYGLATDDDLVLAYHTDDASGSTVTAYVGDDASWNGTPEWLSGKIEEPDSSSTETVQIFNSADGIAINEKGIITFGDGDGRTVFDGQNIRFLVDGVEKARLADNGFFGFGTTVPGAPLTVSATSSSAPALEIQGDGTSAWSVDGSGRITVSGGQTFRLRNNSGSDIMTTDTGNITFPYGIHLTGTGTGIQMIGGTGPSGGIFTGGYASVINFNNNVVIMGTVATTSVKIIARGVASQTANLQEWQDSSSTVLTSIDSAGKIKTFAGIADGTNVVLGTTTGTKFGTATTQKIGFYNATPITQPTEITDELTTITHTAPGTPDYAVQDLIDSSAGAAFGFATKDEGNTVLSVIANLQARVNELETALANLGLLQDSD